MNTILSVRNRDHNHFKEGLLTKNGLIDFAQIWAIRLTARRKMGVASHFWAHKICKIADLTSAVSMLGYREKEADLRLSRVH